MARKTRRRGRRVRITRRFRKVIGGSRKYHNGGDFTTDLKNAYYTAKAKAQEYTNKAKDALRIK